MNLSCIIVDDEPSILAVVSELLVDRQYDIFTAESGLKALQCFQGLQRRNAPSAVGLSDAGYDRRGFSHSHDH